MGQIIQGLDLLDIVGYMIGLNKKFQATFLAALEEIEPDPDKFTMIRKVYLDSSNNFLRSVIKNIFGDIEI